MDLVLAVESTQDDNYNGALLVAQMLENYNPDWQIAVRPAFTAVNSLDGKDCNYMFCGPAALKSMFSGAHCPALNEARRIIGKTGNGQHYSATYRSKLAMQLSWRSIIMMDCLWLMDKAGSQQVPTFEDGVLQGDLIGWDIETDGELQSAWATILTYAVSDGKNVKGGFFPADSPSPALPPGVTLAGHGIKYDLQWWEAHVHPVENPLHCTEIAEGLINDNCTDNSLGFLSTRYTNIPYFKDMVDRAKLAHESPVKVLLYNKYDAISPVHIAKQQRVLLKERGLEQVFEFCMDLTRVFADIEYTGVHIDTEWAYRRGHEVKKLREDALKATGLDLSVLSSTKQLREHLYKDLKLPILKRTKGGEASVDAETLEKIHSRTGNTVVESILDFRKYEKLDNTYYTPIPTWIEHDGRVHTSYSLVSGEFGGTTTGRTSSRNPNLQNIPKSKDDRGMFCATPGWRWADADYSQLELRVVADLSGDTRMCSTFSEGLDIHTDTMSGFSKYSYEEIVRLLDEGDEEMQNLRRGCKCVNFGILYGVGAGTLSNLISKAGGVCDMPTAQQRIDQWRQLYKGVTSWMTAVEDEVIENGYVTMVTGRRRTLLDAERGTPQGQRALRQACNAPVQGTASDITLTAMYLLDQEFRRRGGARLLLNVHDQIGLEFDPSTYTDDDMLEILQRVMVEEVPDEFERRFNYRFTVPLQIDPKVGERWS